eukprot:41063-Eustigmatos_ZCMA.PRE.1
MEIDTVRMKVTLCGTPGMSQPRGQALVVKGAGPQLQRIDKQYALQHTAQANTGRSRACKISDRDLRSSRVH